VSVETNWNISENRAVGTYETIGIDLEPSIDLYGYVYSYFAAIFGEWFGLQVVMKTVPLDIKLIGAHIRKPVTMPEWWITLEEPQNMCFGVSTEAKPIAVEISWAFKYPVCDLSLADFLTWNDPNLITTSNSLWLRTKDLLDNACLAKAYGSGYGNDTPWVSLTLLKYLEQKYEHIPFACDVAFNTPPPQQPFCNPKTDIQCIIGCKPNPADADCQQNPNFIV